MFAVIFHVVGWCGVTLVKRGSRDGGVPRACAGQDGREETPQADTDTGRVSGSGGRHHPSGPRGPQPRTLHTGPGTDESSGGRRGREDPAQLRGRQSMAGS